MPLVINALTLIGGVGLGEQRMKKQHHARDWSNSDEDQRRIRIELAALLATNEFISSRRYPAFLEYVVQRTIEGRGDELKERTIGIEVFQRRVDFDTSADTVVRFTAGEVRRRLQAIYRDSRQDAEVRIDLPLGSYVPVFLFLEDHVPDETEALFPEVLLPGALSPESSPEPVPSAHAPDTRRRAVILSVALFVFCLGLGSFWYVHAGKRSSLEQFWQPAQSGGDPLIIAGAFAISNTSHWALATRDDQYPYYSVAEASAVTSIAEILASAQTSARLQTSVSTTLSDLRDRPIILIGAYNNAWTLRWTEDLRYRFSAGAQKGIYDRKNQVSVGERRNTEFGTTAYSNSDDYAIVARFHDKLTENTIFVIAGVGQNGTVCAGQFATSTRYLDELNARGLGDWADKNIEVVLKTSVVDSKTGPPAIVAVEVW